MLVKIRAFMDGLFSFFSQALATGSKSTTLRPLGWLIVFSVGGTIAAVRVKAPSWLLLLLGVLSGVAIVLYMVGYVYFGITNPDLLRSERYSIQKIAIQHGLIGDSTTGFFRLEGEKVIKADLPEPKTQTEHE